MNSECEHWHWTFPVTGYEIECKACGLHIDLRERPAKQYEGDDKKARIDERRARELETFGDPRYARRSLKPKTWTAFNRNGGLSASVEVMAATGQDPSGDWDGEPNNYALAAFSALNEAFREWHGTRGEMRWWAYQSGYGYDSVVSGEPRYAVIGSKRVGDPESDEGDESVAFIHPACKGRKHKHATREDAEQCPAMSEPDAEGTCLVYGRKLIQQYEGGCPVG